MTIHSGGAKDSRLWILQRRKRQLRTPRWPMGDRSPIHYGTTTIMSCRVDSASACARSRITRPGTDSSFDRDGEHPAAEQADTRSSAVTQCTTRPPNVSDSTRSTAKPPRLSRREASDTESS